MAEKQEYLGVISVAGVQEYISESRKIADLRQGSEDVKVSVKTIVAVLRDDSTQVKHIGAELVKRLREKLRNVKFIIPPGAQAGDECPNQILFEFTPGRNQNVEQEIRQVAKEYFGKLAEESWKSLGWDKNGALTNANIYDIWQRQWADGLPVFFTSLPLNGDFIKAHQALQRKLIVHKLNRRFGPWQGAPVEKCVQCGHRECIGPEYFEGNRKFWDHSENNPVKKLVARNIVRAGERLCAVCLGKRTLALAESKDDPVSSTAFLAVRPFYKKLLSDVDKNGIRQVVSDFEKRAEAMSVLLPPEYPKYKALDFKQESTAFFKDRKSRDNAEWFLEDFYAPSQWKWLDLDETKPQQFDEACGATRAALKKLYEKLKWEPSEYLTVIEYDGDKMGERTGALDRSTLEKVSEKLTKLAAKDLKKVVQDHDGYLIYSGGEDLLAFCPMEKAVSLLAAINDTFVAAMKGFEIDGDSFTGSGSATFFQYDFPLHRALAISKENIHRAKEEFDRDAFVLGGVLPNGSSHVFGGKSQPRDMGEPILTWVQTTLALFGSKGHPIEADGVTARLKVSRTFRYELMEILPVFLKEEQGRRSLMEKDALVSEVTRLFRRYSSVDETPEDETEKKKLNEAIEKCRSQWVRDFVDGFLTNCCSTVPEKRELSNEAGLLKLLDFYLARIKGPKDE